MAGAQVGGGELNCVYDAYVEHLKDLDLTPFKLDQFIYDVLKSQYHWHRPEPTYGGVVPMIIDGMRRHHKLDMRVQHGLLTKAHHLEDAQNPRQFLLIEMHSQLFGEYAFPLTLEPAIYLLYADSHAIYSRTVPTYGMPIMAIQLRKSNEER